MQNKDCESGKGGGIIVYVSEALTLDRKFNSEADGFECI